VLAVVAVIVACTVIPYMVRHYGMVKALAPAAPVCATGQSEGCVGGRVQIIMAPAATSATSATPSAAQPASTAAR
jgi:hypothetical protein